MTSRQREIVYLVCDEGLSRKEIGTRLRISEATVKNHITPMLRALQEMSMNRVCTRYGRGEFGALGVRSIYKEGPWKPDDV